MNSPAHFLQSCYARRLMMGLVLLLFALWLGWPLVAVGGFHDVWYHSVSDDSLRWPYLLMQFYDSFRAGNLYPRWLPHALGDYGYPTFVFYQPGFFYFALPFVYVLGDGVAATAAAAITAIALGGIGAYRLARQWNGARLSMACAFVFMLTPFAAGNLYGLGDITQFFAMQFCPWSLYLGLRLIAKVHTGKPLGKAVVAFIAITGMLVLSHPFVPLFFLPFLAAMMVTAGLTGKRAAEALWVSALSLLMVMAATSAYWFTLFQMKESVRYQGVVSGFNPLNHFVDVHKLGWIWFGQQLTTLVAAVGFVVAWRNPLMRVAAVFCLLYMLMLFSVSRPLWVVLFPVLQYVQYPMRIMTVLPTIYLLGIIQACRLVRQCRVHYAAMIVAAFLAVSIALSFQSYQMSMTVEAAIRPFLAEGAEFNLPGAWLRPVDYDALMQRLDFVNFLIPRNFDPPQMTFANLPNRQTGDVSDMQMAPWAKERGELRMLPQSTPFMPLAEVKTTASAAVLVNQFYLPGWEVEVNGERVQWNSQMMPAEPLAAGVGLNGRVRIWLGRPGTYRVRAWYAGPPHWRERNMAAVSLMLLLTGGLYWRRRLMFGWTLQMVGKPVAEGSIG